MSRHNEATGFEEDLELCTPLQPVLAVKVFLEEARKVGLNLEDLELESFESGGEDMPDAYRWIPVKPAHLRFNVIATYNYARKLWQFQIVYGCLFGLSSSVMNFNPWPRFLEALVRRWLAVLVAMFYDDASIQDLARSCGRGQRYLRAVFRMVGAPLAPEKATDLGPEADFLGVRHNLSEAMARGEITLQPRTRTREKSTLLQQQALTENHCNPVMASEARGGKSFTMLAYFGKVAG